MYAEETNLLASFIPGISHVDSWDLCSDGRSFWAQTTTQFEEEPLQELNGRSRFPWSLHYFPGRFIAGPMRRTRTDDNPSLKIDLQSKEEDIRRNFTLAKLDSWDVVEHPKGKAILHSNFVPNKSEMAMVLLPNIKYVWLYVVMKTLKPAMTKFLLEKISYWKSHFQQLELKETGIWVR